MCAQLEGIQYKQQMWLERLLYVSWLQIVDENQRRKIKRKLHIVRFKLSGIGVFKSRRITVAYKKSSNEESMLESKYLKMCLINFSIHI